MKIKIGEIQYRECKVCEEQIKVIGEKVLTGAGNSNSAHTAPFSEEGVFVPYLSNGKNYSGMWLCNDCYEKIYNGVLNKLINEGVIKREEIRMNTNKKGGRAKCHNKLN